ncbi:MAG: enoyl-CoA hydratase/isomerase family protein [Myxococcota bacterium]
MASDLITLEIQDGVAVLSNNRPEKHNAANDEMDAQLWQALGELHGREDVRAIVWRGNGKSFSSGRDTTQLGVRTEDISNLDFIERGHAGTQNFFSVPAPIIVALKGWVIGGSFERALLCDMRVAGESARMMLPEVKHGVVPDSGGTARLFQMAGHGLAADLALTGRALDAEEALRHGIVSRVVPDEALDDTCLEMAHEIARMPAFTVKMFRRTLSRLADPAVKASIQEEAVTQVLTQASDDYAEFKAARSEEREPRYRRR